MKKMKQLVSAVLILVLTLSCTVSAFAADQTDLEKRINQTINYLQKTVKEPQISSVGGEWTVIGLARSGVKVPAAYFTDYYEIVEKEIREKEGILHSRKYTEYSRVSLAMMAIGAEPSDVGSYDILKPLLDTEKVLYQGINGPVWALIALNNSPYAKNDVYQRYVDVILAKQLSDGGWNLSGSGNADPDVTGMVLQALAGYQEQPFVIEATEKALSCLSQLQDEKGGFTSYDMNNSESIVQVIVALGELGIPLEDARFVKNGNTLLDALFTYQNRDGSFSHTGDGNSNLMATEQGLYGMVSAWRNMTGKSSLYDMDDVTISVQEKKAPQKDTDKVESEYFEKTFVDIQGHEAKREIEALASRGIISGMDADSFAPDATMTRAQFASVIVRALNLPQKQADVFSDVRKGDWFWSVVGTAYYHGLVSGRTETTFDPNGTITRQEAASMVARAAKYCGMDISMEPGAIMNQLTLFGDYPSVSNWARESVAFCYKEGILNQDDWNIEPARNITRSEVAEMLYHLLEQSELL